MDKSYGEIYKKNQSGYWKNLWFYNKKIIIGVLIAVAVIIYSVVSCSNIVRPDASVLYISRGGMSPDVVEVIKNKYSPLIEDINNDGETFLEVYVLTVPFDNPAEIDIANKSRINTEILNGDSDVIIAEKSLVEAFVNLEDFFTPLEISKYPPVKNKNGDNVAVDITESEFASVTGYDKKDSLYMFLRNELQENSEYNEYLQGKIIAEKISME